jgi:hypothetical protein
MVRPNSLHSAVRFPLLLCTMVYAAVLPLDMTCSLAIVCRASGRPRTGLAWLGRRSISVEVVETTTEIGADADCDSRRHGGRGAAAGDRSANHRTRKAAATKDPTARPGGKQCMYKAARKRFEEAIVKARALRTIAKEQEGKLKLAQRLHEMRRCGAVCGAGGWRWMEAGWLATSGSVARRPSRGG